MSLPHGGGLFIKGYKELLRKTVSGHGHDVADSYSTGSVLPQSAANATILMLRAEFSFKRAFTRFKFAALGGSSISGGLRSRWRASKDAARERLKTVLGTYVDYTPAALASSKELVQQASNVGAIQTPAETRPAYDDSLQSILGQDGPLRRSIIYVLASMSRGFMTAINHTEVQNGEVMERALQRPAGQALITVSNHIAALDDPLVMATIIPPAYYTQPESIRWTMCATDRCFKYGALSRLFTAGKVLPVERGAGLSQAGVRAAEERLAAGDWVHIFPEGTRGGAGKPLGPVRRGVGRLVASCPVPPLVVPFVHSGMEEVMPRGKMFPAVGKQVKVLVGDPIALHDIMEAAEAQQWGEDRLHRVIAERVGRRLKALKAQLDGLPVDEHQEVLLPQLAGAGGGGVEEIVSPSGEAFYPAIASTQPSSLWERLRFKSSHRQWRLLSGSVLSDASILGLRNPQLELQQVQPAPQALVMSDVVVLSANPAARSVFPSGSSSEAAAIGWSGAVLGVSRALRQLASLESAPSGSGSAGAGRGGPGGLQHPQQQQQQHGEGRAAKRGGLAWLRATQYVAYARERSERAAVLMSGPCQAGQA